MTHSDARQAVNQNLIDAGCDSALIVQYFSLEALGKPSNQMALLAAHRKALLDQIHQLQKALDCLDYLIYKLKKER